MDELIFDRTQADVNYAKANPSSTDFLKGAYNYTDLNRIEEWCSYLATKLQAAGYNINITTKTDWSMADFPTQAQLERIRSNVNTIKTAFATASNIPTNMSYMTYKKANDIERVLNELHNRLWGMTDWYVYSGVANAGQNRLWQHRFREFYVNPITPTGNFLTTETGDVLITESGDNLEVDET